MEGVQDGKKRGETMKSNISFILLCFVFGVLIGSFNPGNNSIEHAIYILGILLGFIVLLYVYASVLANNMKLTGFFFRQTYNGTLTVFYGHIFKKNYTDALVAIEGYEKRIGYKQFYKFVKVNTLLIEGKTEEAKELLDGMKKSLYKTAASCNVAIMTKNDEMYQEHLRLIKNKSFKLAVEADALYFNDKHEEAEIKAKEAISLSRGFQKYVFIKQTEEKRPDGYPFYF